MLLRTQLLYNLPLTLFEFHHNLWLQKTRVHDPSCGVVSVNLNLAILTKYWCVMDIQTHVDSICHASTVKIYSGRSNSQVLQCHNGHEKFTSITD